MIEVRDLICFLCFNNYNYICNWMYIFILCVCYLMKLNVLMEKLMDVKRLKEYFCRILRSGIGICYKFL